MQEYKILTVVYLKGKCKFSVCRESNGGGAGGGGSVTVPGKSSDSAAGSPGEQELLPELG